MHSIIVYYAQLNKTGTHRNTQQDARASGPAAGGLTRPQRNAVGATSSLLLVAKGQDIVYYYV